MDQFLPSEISVMILRYLASMGCETTVLAMIEEMPVLKLYVPGQRPGVSKSDYIRSIGRPSLAPGLVDILNDYGNSKMFVTEVIQQQKPEGSPLRHCDSLVTQLKQLSNTLNSLTKTVTTSDNLQRLEEKVMSDVGTNTDPESIPQEQCLAVAKLTLEAETQTDFPIVDLESGESEALEVPLMFYNTLMADSSLQQKLAMVINENMTDPNSSNDDKLQKVCSKAETEIDKFLVDLLQDVPPEDEIGNFPTNSLSLIRMDSSQNDVVERNLSSLFNDANSIIGNDPVIPIPPTDNDAIQDEDKSADSPTTTSNDLETSQNSNQQCSSVSIEGLGSSGEDIGSKSLNERPQNSDFVAKKRILPKPAPVAKANPVFEKFEVEHTVGTQGLRYSVKKKIPVPNDWQKLGRRPIDPKIPPLPPVTSASTCSNNIQSVESVVEKVPSPGTSASTSSNVVQPIESVVEKVPPTALPSSAVNELLQPPVSTAKKYIPAEPSSSDHNPSALAPQNKDLMSANKRKAKLSTPVKLTPEKAKSFDHNFFHVYHETQKSGSITAGTPNTQGPTANLGIQVTSQDASRSYQTPSDKPHTEERIVFPLLKTTNAAEVTPILDSSSPVKTVPSSAPDFISPRLSRLICSAQKFRATTTYSNLPKKSFSTPRKKKHVRSLCFSTPPSLKNKQPSPPGSPSSSKVTNAHGVSISLPQKRKLNSPEDEQPKRKSRKRLQWSEDSENMDAIAYKSSAFPDRVFNAKHMSDSMILSAKRVLETKTCGPGKGTTSMTDQPAVQNVLESTTETIGTVVSRHSNGVIDVKKASIQALPKIPEEPVNVLESQLPVQSISPASLEANSRLVPTSENAVPTLPTLVAVSSLTSSPTHSSKPVNVLPSVPTSITLTSPRQQIVSSVELPEESIGSPIYDEQENHVCQKRTTNLLKSREEIILELFGSNTPEKEVEESITANNQQRKSEENLSRQNTSYDIPQGDNISGRKGIKQSFEQPTDSKDAPEEEKSYCLRIGGKNSLLKPQAQRNCRKSLTQEKSTKKTPGKKISPIGVSEKSSRKTPPMPEKSTRKTPPMPEKSTRKSLRNNTSPNKSKKGGRTKRLSLDTVAAQIVANTAVPLGQGRTVSPKSPRKIAPKRGAGCLSPRKPDVSDGSASLPQAVAPVSFTSSATKVIEATPLKESLVDFSILPAPLGFPDPTPTKAPNPMPIVEFQTTSGFLVTPIKSGPHSELSLPQTPRYIVHEADIDSNSTWGSCKFAEGMYSSSYINCTPSKLLAPPTTPGRNLFDNNRNSSVLLDLELSNSIPVGREEIIEHTTATAPLDLTSPMKHQHHQPLKNHENALQITSRTEKELEKSNSKTVVSDNRPQFVDVKKPQVTITPCPCPGTTDNDNFQVPKGIPKKASPPINNSAKKLRKSSTTEKLKNVNTSASQNPISPNLTTPENQEKSNSYISGLSKPGIRFTVSGATKMTTMSGNNTLVTLIELGRKINNFQQAGPAAAGSSSEKVKGESSRLQNLLKNVDLNKFLINIHKQDNASSKQGPV